MSFEKALKIVLVWEGGYVNDPHDPGGETKYGISKKTYPHLDIKNLTVEAAAKIYKKDYWDECQCEKLPASIAILVFDTAVNMGTKRAIVLLQKAIDVFPDVIIGPVTIAAANGLNISLIARNFMAYRTKYYASLDGWERYGIGWMRRCFDVSHRAFID